MTPIAEIMTRMLASFLADKDTMAATLCREVATGLMEIYPDGMVPASEIILVEELFLIRITSHLIENLLGSKGMFYRRNEVSAGVIHPALATTMKNRERYKKTWNNLAWRHGVAGLQPSREKALAKAANAAGRTQEPPHSAPLRASLQTPPPNVGPLVKPDVVAGFVNGSGKVTREDLLRAGKAAVAV